MSEELVDKVRRILIDDYNFLVDEIERVSDVKAGLEEELTYTEKALKEMEEYEKGNDLF